MFPDGRKKKRWEWKKSEPEQTFEKNSILSLY
jgi:hypothetical protein